VPWQRSRYSETPGERSVIQALSDEPHALPTSNHGDSCPRLELQCNVFITGQGRVPSHGIAKSSDPCREALSPSERWTQPANYRSTLVDLPSGSWALVTNSMANNVTSERHVGPLSGRARTQPAAR
jgi:hypothetical protein